MPIPLMAILGGAMGGMGIANMFPPLTRWGQYGLNRGWRNEILQPPEAIEAHYRNLIDDGELDHELASLGFNEARIKNLVGIRQQLFNAIESIILWRREEISEDDLSTRLQKVGIKEDEIPLWVNFTETRPSVQDIIRFAVREVYTPEIAEKFGQFEGADEVAKIADKDLKAVGVRPEDLQKYWASHWELPGVNQGFEMLHRGVITVEELDLLMRALDVMPFWRDKLVEISYNPLTRVDVRRMHKLGVLDEKEVFKAYKDFGYNADNAQRMTDFTVLYNADPIDAEKTQIDKERDLTKTDIISGFADGLFSEQESGSALLMLGYDQTEIEYYFSRVLYEQEKDNINTYTRAYRAAYIGNTKTRNEITAAFGVLNLTGKRVENLFNIWDIEKSVRVAKPTKSEVLMFLRRKIIDKATAMTELAGMGYDARYIEWYLATI